MKCINVGAHTFTSRKDQLAIVVRGISVGYAHMYTSIIYDYNISYITFIYYSSNHIMNHTVGSGAGQ